MPQLSNTKMRIELCKSAAEADHQRQILAASGFNVTMGPKAKSIVWVTLSTDPNNPITFADPSDNEIWVVIGEK